MRRALLALVCFLLFALSGATTVHHSRRASLFVDAEATLELRRSHHKAFAAPPPGNDPPAPRLSPPSPSPKNGTTPEKVAKTPPAANPPSKTPPTTNTTPSPPAPPAAPAPADPAKPPSPSAPSPSPAPSASPPSTASAKSPPAGAQLPAASAAAATPPAPPSLSPPTASPNPATGPPPTSPAPPQPPPAPPAPAPVSPNSPRQPTDPSKPISPPPASNPAKPPTPTKPEAVAAVAATLPAGSPSDKPSPPGSPPTSPGLPAVAAPVVNKSSPASPAAPAPPSPASPSSPAPPTGSPSGPEHSPHGAKNQPSNATGEPLYRDRPQQIAVAFGLEIERKYLPTRTIFRSEHPREFSVWLELGSQEWRWSAGTQATLSNGQRTSALMLDLAVFQSIVNNTKILDPAWKNLTLPTGHQLVLKCLLKYEQQRAAQNAAILDPKLRARQKFPPLDPFEIFQAALQTAVPHSSLLLAEFPELPRVKEIMQCEQLMLDTFKLANSMKSVNNITLTPTFQSKGSATIQAATALKGATKIIHLLVMSSKALASWGKAGFSRVLTYVNNQRGTARFAEYLGLMRKAAPGKKIMTAGFYEAPSKECGALLLVGAQSLVSFTGNIDFSQFVDYLTSRLINRNPMFRLAEHITPRAYRYSLFKQSGLPGLIALGMAMFEEKHAQIQKYLDRLAKGEYAFMVGEASEIAQFWKRKQRGVMQSFEKLVLTVWYSP